MKVLLVHNYYPVIGGGEDSVVAEERAMLEQAGHTVVPFFRYTKERGVRDFLLSALCLFWNPSVYYQIRKLLRKERPDVVHCHNTFPLISPAVYWACAREKVPVVQTLHNYRLVCANGLFLRNGKICEECSGRRFPWPALRYRCYRGSLVGSLLLILLQWGHRKMGTWRRKVNRYITLTRFSKSRYVESGVLEAGSILVKPNFIDDAVLTEGSEDKSDLKYAMYIGRLWEEKGGQVLVDGWTLAQQQMGDMNDYHLLIAGEGPERPRLEHQIKAQYSCHNIRFIGAVPRGEAIRLLRSARFLILPSICYENFPMTIVEAYACGVPVIATELGNMASLVTNYKTGLFFKANRADELAERIMWAIHNEDEMAIMGRNARLKYEQSYSMPVNYECLMNIYMQVNDSCSRRDR